MTTLQLTERETEVSGKQVAHPGTQEISVMSGLLALRFCTGGSAGSVPVQSHLSGRPLKSMTDGTVLQYGLFPPRPASCHLGPSLTFPQGHGQEGSPGLEAFHRAKSLGERFSLRRSAETLRSPVSEQGKGESDSVASPHTNAHPAASLLHWLSSLARALPSVPAETRANLCLDR